MKWYLHGQNIVDRDNGDHVRSTIRGFCITGFVKATERVEGRQHFECFSLGEITIVVAIEGRIVSHLGDNSD